MPAEVRSDVIEGNYKRIIAIDSGVRNLVGVSISHRGEVDGRDGGGAGGGGAGIGIESYDRETNFKLSSAKHFSDRKLKEFEKQRKHYVGSYMQYELQELQRYSVGNMPTPGLDWQTFIEFKLRMFNRATEAWMQPEVARIRLAAYQTKQKVPTYQPTYLPTYT